MRMLKRAAAACAVPVLAALALVASAQTPAPELPKGIFPGGVPPQSAPAAPARADAPASPGIQAQGEPARDPLGRVAVPPAAPVTDLAGVLSPAAEDALRRKLMEFERARG